MGGADAMYRIVLYKGEWVEGQRTGQGVVEYPNGLVMCGELDKGKFEGTVKVVWPKNQGVRLALYRRGERVAWMPQGAQPGSYLGGPKGVKTGTVDVLTELLGAGAPRALEMQRRAAGMARRETASEGEKRKEPKTPKSGRKPTVTWGV